MDTVLIISIIFAVIGLIAYIVHKRKRVVPVQTKHVGTALQEEKPAEIPRRTIVLIDPDNLQKPSVFIDPENLKE